MKEEIEFEKKFLVKNEDTFFELKGLLRDQSFQEVLGYVFEKYYYKERTYRCFDTFEGDLAREKAVLECIGELEKKNISFSARARENDYIITAKFPTLEREERFVYENLVDNEHDFYSLTPEDFPGWKPFDIVRGLAGGRSLQEVVRLHVKTSRLFFSSGEGGLEISLDEVLGKFPFPFNNEVFFYEMEIEQEGEIPRTDVKRVSEYFMQKYPLQMVDSPEPKWIKALKLLRGETL